jgi:hypothetical protein
MAAQEGKTYNQGHPVPFRRPGAGVVFLSNVLLFLMVFSPVWGALLGGWAVWEVGSHIRGGVREWRMEHREWERHEWERRPAGADGVARLADAGPRRAAVRRRAGADGVLSGSEPEEEQDAGQPRAEREDEQHHSLQRELEAPAGCLVQASFVTPFANLTDEIRVGQRDGRVHRGAHAPNDLSAQRSDLVRRGQQQEPAHGIEETEAPNWGIAEPLLLAQRMPRDGLQADRYEQQDAT